MSRHPRRSLPGDESALRGAVAGARAWIGSSCPLILFQGLEDKVVPPNQSEMVADALRRKGRPVAYLAFEGEQHGFRKAENIIRSLEAELYFYGAVFGFAARRPHRAGGDRESAATNMRTALAWIVVAAGAVASAAGVAQDAPRAAAGQPAGFDAASVKVNASGDRQRSVGFQPGGRFVARNMTLRGLVAAAYGAPPLPLYRVVGGPGWVDADRFDIAATVDGRSDWSRAGGLVGRQPAAAARSAGGPLPPGGATGAARAARLRAGRGPQRPPARRAADGVAVVRRRGTTRQALHDRRRIRRRAAGSASRRRIASRAGTSR